MKIKTAVISLLILMGCVGAGYYFWHHFYEHTSFKIRDFDYQTDGQAIDALFHKGDNFYWMIGGRPEHRSEYSVDFMLRYRSSSQYEKKYNLILKTILVDGRIAGLLAYHPESSRVWRLLFLIVDQDFRGRGFAKKMLKYAVDDMLARGAIQLVVYTRNNNFKAQKMYTDFGFKQVGTSNEGVHYSWNP
jgi:ribosomal protein S18 acetylase RimI-like enzyme